MSNFKHINEDFCLCKECYKVWVTDNKPTKEQFVARLDKYSRREFGYGVKIETLHDRELALHNSLAKNMARLTGQSGDGFKQKVIEEMICTLTQLSELLEDKQNGRSSKV